MGPVLMPPVLTREQVIAMQDALIAEYSKTLFQEKLGAMHREVDGSVRKAARYARAYRELCKIWEVVGTRFGFEASPEGVAQSIAVFTADLNTDPDISERYRRMSLMVAPLRHDELGAKRVEALGAWVKWSQNIEQRSQKQASAEPCAIWRTPVKKPRHEEDCQRWEDEEFSDEEAEEPEAEEPEDEDGGISKKEAFMSRMLNLLHKKHQDNTDDKEPQSDLSYEAKKQALHKRMQQLLHKKKSDENRANEEEDEYDEDESDREDAKEIKKPICDMHLEKSRYDIKDTIKKDNNWGSAENTAYQKNTTAMTAKERLQEMLIRTKAEQATHAVESEEEEDSYAEDEEEEDEEEEETEKSASAVKDRLREMLQRERAK